MSKHIERLQMSLFQKCNIRILGHKNSDIYLSNLASEGFPVSGLLGPSYNSQQPSKTQLSAR